MDSFFNLLRKSLVLTTMVVFGFVFTYVPQYFNRVAEVQAFCPVPCPGFEVPGPQLTAVVATAAATGASAAANTSLAAKENILDGIAFMIGKAIISSLIGSLIKWINSGFEGRPAFIQDFKRFVLEAADRAAGEFIRDLGGIGSFICSPFQLDIQIALALEYQQAREHENPIGECRLSGIVDNLKDFYEGSFSESSLEDFINITSNPGQYTPYGQLLTARTAMRIRLANEQGEVLTEADWGGGFLSGRICQAIEGSNGPRESCVISKPGQVIAGSLNKALGAGQDQLVAADEINELVAALISQLANQAIVGAAGLLGLTTGTGHTSAGFNGGSYLNAATAQAGGLAASSSAEAIANVAGQFSAARAVQSDAVQAANAAIPALLAYRNNPRNLQEKRDAADNAYQSAVNTRNKALADIPKIDRIQNEFLALQAEGAAANTTLERKQAIAQRLVVLQSNFLNLGTITHDALIAISRTWVPPNS